MVEIAPEPIIFGTAWSIVLIWGILKVCVNYLIDVPDRPRLHRSAKQAA